ncbi:MAG: hypothetical protein IKR61_04535 [Lachnospiraceae bacterium]|nr:hypothetical protein [Lachnospiraceae bacterium]
MANLLTTLFASDQKFLASHLSDVNKINAFPVRNLVPADHFIRSVCRDSVLISGGTDEERSVLLMGLIQHSPDCVVLLQNGNRYLDADMLRRHGIPAGRWEDSLYNGLSKAEMLSMLAGDEKDFELAPFYTFAFDVCETLGKPVTPASLMEIDWIGISWQQDLLAVSGQRDRALDLINRYDRDMAARAAKGICKIERLTRSIRGNRTATAPDFASGKVLVREVYGSSSALCRQCLEVIRLSAEKGHTFTLILDDLYLPDAPVIRENYRNVRLILSAEDLTQLSGDLRLTNRSCDIVAFNHPAYGSAKAISEQYFGEYERLFSDSTTGYSQSFLEPKARNASLTVRRGRDTRLPPEQLTALPLGYACVRLKNGIEGSIRIMGG